MGILFYKTMFMTSWMQITWLISTTGFFFGESWYQSCCFLNFKHQNLTKISASVPCTLQLYSNCLFFLAGFPEQKHPENIHHQTILENCTMQNMKTKNTESNQDTTNATCCSDSKPCELKTWDQLLNGLVKGKHHILLPVSFCWSTIHVWYMSIFPFLNILFEYPQIMHKSRIFSNVLSSVCKIKTGWFCWRTISLEEMMIQQGSSQQPKSSWCWHW